MHNGTRPTGRSAGLHHIWGCSIPRKKIGKKQKIEALACLGIYLTRWWSPTMVFWFLFQTNGEMVPYLKGIHLTINSWQPEQNEDRWKSTSTVETKCEMEKREKPPKLVRMVPRLCLDIEVLLDFTDQEKCPKVPVQPTGAAVAMYMFGDASGSGFRAGHWKRYYIYFTRCLG
jgi:hypothetical protein